MPQPRTSKLSDFRLNAPLVFHCVAVDHPNEALEVDAIHRNEFRKTPIVGLK